MPYSDPEWVELYNNNDYPVKLVGWKIGHNTSTTKNFDLTINSKSYGTFDFSNFFGFVFSFSIFTSPLMRYIIALLKSFVNLDFIVISYINKHFYTYLFCSST